MKHNIFIYFSLCLLLFTSCNTKNTLVKEGVAQTKIIVCGNLEDQKAAQLLQNFTEQISGVYLPILFKKEDYKAQKGDIVIGNAQELPENLKSKTHQLKEDGFLLAVEEEKVYIYSGGDKGSIYAIVDLLEQYWGVNYWGEDEYDFPPQETLSLPTLCKIENPAFRYRQSQNYAMKNDTKYALFNRLETPEQVFAAKYWVHTFNRLLPAKIYGKSHPEYYAFYNGKRHPGKATQWCLTNPDVFEIVAHKVDSIFKANPDKNIISISQNDGNFTHCRCPKCQKIEKEEGAISGNFIHFLNKLAKRFPDKEFSTLAYLFTMHPPKKVKPLPNVNIMLCDIDCKREVPLTDNVSGKDFVKALQGWSRITNNIFVWDYGINFDNYLSPFPNFHVLQPNIQLFKKHHVTMHFSQIASSKGGNFAELRTYLVSKLMWNPNENVDSLMHHFLNGYYGKAGAPLYTYIKTMEKALKTTKAELWIYDSPVTFKSNILRAEMLKKYNALFDEAEAAVKNNKILLKRVQMQRLTLQYSELELARTKQKKDLKHILQLLNLFEKRVKAFDIPTLNERSNSPVDYCQLYRKRYLPQKEKNIAQEAEITYLTSPSKGYAQRNKKTLTDGLYGGATFVDSWIGWEGIDASLILDLKKATNVKSITTDFLHQLGAWILLPRKVVYSYSKDGKNYHLLQSIPLAEDKDNQVKFKEVTAQFKNPTSIRFIKIEIIGTKECPGWHYGVGHPCWFFMDEITVK